MDDDIEGSRSRDPGSFRDPDSAVFHADGRVLRGLSERAAQEWGELNDTSFFSRLQEDGLVVASSVYDGPVAPSPRGEPWALVLEHERVPFVSYPYEWPFAMLREAARCHLDVLLAALEEGHSLKDGTAYNVQFFGSRPVFIDVGSFEPATGPWPGYRQFCRTFLFPLLIHAHLGIPHQPALRGRMEGLTPAEVSSMFRGVRRFRRGVLRNVTFQAYADRKVKADSEQVKRNLRSAGFGVELAKATVGKLRKLVTKLDVGRRSSTWVDYRDTCSYSDDDTRAKETFVDDACARAPGAKVLDLGANDGAFSLVAARHASSVVAVDNDELVIDQLYRRLRAEGIENVLPLVVDLTDPPPDLGWRNLERPAFAQRTRPDLVLALALVHHLAIGANIPLGEVVAWLRSFDARLVVELPHRDDPMTERLLAQKPPGLFDDYGRETFEVLLEKHFAVDRRSELPGGTRTLYLTEPR